MNLKPWKYRADSVSTMLGQQGSTFKHAVRMVTDTQTDYCNPAAHAQRVNNVITISPPCLMLTNT